MDEEEVKCSNCGTPVERSLEGSLDTLLEGYIHCKGCGTRIEIESDALGEVKKSIDKFKATIKQVNRRLSR